MTQPVQLSSASKHILVLYSYGYGGKGVRILDDGFLSVLSEAGVAASDIHCEFLDLGRHQEDSQHVEQLQATLLRRYAPHQIDLIVTVQQPALGFLLDQGRQLAPGAPVITVQSPLLTNAQAQGRQFLCQTAAFDIKGTLQRAMELFPATQRVVFVSGASDADRKMAAAAATAAAPWQGKLEFEYTTDLALSQMLQRVSTLPPNTIIVFTQYNRDAAGLATLAYEVEGMITKVANSPVFGLYDFNLSNNGIGGSVISVKSLGESTARAALDILHGRLQLKQPVTAANNQPVPIFDWQQIHRWGGYAGNLPKETIFTHRPPSLWDQYKVYVIVIAVALVAQSFLIVGLIINRHRRQVAEKLLRTSEQEFRSLAEAMPQIAWVCRPDGRNIYFNQQWVDYTGLTLEESYGHGWNTPFHPDDRQRAWDAWQNATKNHDIYSLECRLRRADGIYRWWLVRGVPLRNAEGEILKWFGTCTDIEEIKQVEAALRESEKRFRVLFEQVAVGVAQIRSDTGQFLRINQKYCDIVGYSRQEMEHLDFQTITHPDDLANDLANMESLRAETIRQFIIEKRYFRKDGSLVWVKLTVSPMWAPGEPPSSHVAVVEDITGRKQAEEKLHQSEARYRRLFEAAKDGILILDAETGMVVDVNPFMVELLGFSRELFLGKKVWELGFFKDLVANQENFAELQQNEYIRYEDLAMETSDGRRIEVEFISNVYLVDHQKVIQCNVRDITERKRAEEQWARLEAQLQQAQKMESVGRLAGGVAHDFNNMLGVILGHTEIALDRLGPAHPLYANLEEIGKAGERSANLTRQLLAFARKQTVVPKVLDLNEAVSGLFKMLQRLIGEDIGLAWNPKADLWPVKVDPTQIDQILVNLCVNARDAISGVGKMTIETQNTTLDDNYCANHPGYVPGEYVRLAVSDTGSGMDKETQSHLFEPFFTTKGVTKGTGLGLATIYGAVKQNNGFIHVYSEPGQGTTFTIYLPRYVGKGEPVQTQVAVEPTMGGNETILLVEDEPALLKLTTMMLEDEGYTVLAANAPGQAIRLAGEYVGEIHLLMTDVVMPEMNGRDLAKNLVSRYPHLKRLFMSGYTADVIAHHGVLDEGVCFLEKPFSAENLAAKVRGVLNNG